MMTRRPARIARSREDVKVLLVLRILLGLLVIAVLLLAAGIAGNRPPMSYPPGMAARLKIYMTTHRAETRSDSIFPELRPREYRLPPQQLYAAARATVVELGWPLLAEDSTTLRLHAVVATRLWKFKDDFKLTVEPTAEGCRLQMSSESRVSRGDLGANTRHILDFSAALERRLAALNPRR
jgi:uncharacterized protein (DUF1499 family)